MQVIATIYKHDPGNDPAIAGFPYGWNIEDALGGPILATDDARTPKEAEADVERWCDEEGIQDVQIDPVWELED